MTCLAPLNMGIRDSGSVAYVASSISTCLNLTFLNLLSKAATQVVQITSAFLIISSSACLIKSFNVLSSFSDSSPISSFLFYSSCIYLNGPCLRCLTYSCRDRKSTFDPIDSLERAHNLTTLIPVPLILSVS